MKVDRLAELGVPISGDLRLLVRDATKPTSESEWLPKAERLKTLAQKVRSTEQAYAEGARSKAHALAEWVGLSSARLKEVDQRLNEALADERSATLADALVRLNEIVGKDFPEIVSRRAEARSTGATLLTAGRELGVDTAQIESSLSSDAAANPLGWKETIPALEAANAAVAEELRGRVITAIESLRETLLSLREYGVDPTSPLVTVEETLARVSSAPPAEVPALLARARAVTEEPVVAVVAGLLDEVRPRIVQARRLGRDSTEVFAAMNRAREALRLKIYTEALAASQDAIDRISQLTEDMDSAREEADSLESMLQSLRKAKFPVEPFEAPLAQARTLLDRIEVTEARNLLRETVRSVGRDAVAFFKDRLDLIQDVMGIARERGFLPPGADAEFGQARAHLESGELGEASELIAQLEVHLRTQAAPFVSRRVEEMERGFVEIPDEVLVGPVRRLLADAEVNLRVKEDLIGSLDSLRRAERDFSSVFAAHASALVEGLEGERRALEAMGGAGDEIQRQIDEVQQIFNMGDFVKASRASHEIRTRAQQQQLLRSEEAVSHAKLALVELETMGLELGDLKVRLDAAQEASQQQRYSVAFKGASEVNDAATRTRAGAQGVIDLLDRSQEMWQNLRQSGAPVEGYRDQIHSAKLSYQARDFEGARAQVETLSEKLAKERSNVETDHLISESSQLIEDGHRLAVPIDPFVRRVAETQAHRASGNSETARAQAEVVRMELVTILRPVLEENLRSLERDLDLARSAGVDSPKVVESLAEARRRLSLPVPTGVAELIETARGHLMETRGFLEHAERVAKRARESLAQADLLHVDLTPFRTRLERIERHLSERQSARVIELASTIEREVIQATYQQVSKTLAGFQGTISRVRQAGSDTTIAENLLNQARAALEEGRPVEALQLAGRSEGELERVELQRGVATGSIEATDRRLSRANSEGIRAPVATTEFEKAKQALAQHDYMNALELAFASSDSLAFAQENHRHSREALETAERQLSEATALGADVREIATRLSTARTLSEQGEYQDATRHAREVSEMGRWAIEQLYTGALTDVRRLIETARAEGLSTELDGIRRPLEDAEAALQTREWRRAALALERAKAAAQRALEALVEGREKELPSLYDRDAPASPEEEGRRAGFHRELTALREQRDYAAAFALLKEERSWSRDRWRLDLVGRVNALKDRLWIGEKLGLDTTPAMQNFSEAKIAVDADKLEAVEGLLGRGEGALEKLVQGRLEEKLREVRTELTFAIEGLHVIARPVDEAIAAAELLRGENRWVDAAKILLEAEDDLNRRKALHRELLNLHYLIDAALAKAAERRLDTTEPRKLLEDSIRLRETDYSQALERAREAHRMLQEMLKTPGQQLSDAGAPPASSTARAKQAAPTFWPFRKSAPPR